MIRLAKLKDLPTIVSIYNEAVALGFATADLASVSVASKRAWFAEHDPKQRPIYVWEDAKQIKGWCSDMLAHANLICTAWDGDVLVGVSRSLTDFSFCCYLSDLAVDVAYQKKGVGKELVRLTQAQLHPQCKIILLAAPKAEGYYSKIGFSHFHSAWVLSPNDKRT